MKKTEELVVGVVPNIAARVQSLAAVDSVLISGDTRRLSQDKFNCKSLGLKDLKGISQPVEILRVVQELSDSDHNFESSTGFIGRDEELGILPAVWNPILNLPANSYY